MPAYDIPGARFYGLPSVVSDPPPLLPLPGRRPGPAPRLMKSCAGCEGLCVQRKTENRTAFARRKYCSPGCAGIGGQQSWPSPYVSWEVRSGPGAADEVPSPSNNVRLRRIRDQELRNYRQAIEAERTTRPALKVSTCA